MLDNYDFFVRHEEKAYQTLIRLPKCCCCEEHITSEMGYHLPDGSWCCEDCMNDMHEYIEE